MYRTLKLDVARAIATVTLNRPASRNAMSAELMREMIACAGRLAARRDVDVVIVRGSGGCFSAGADLKDRSRWGNRALPLERQRDIAALGYRMARAWEELPQITLAAIEGYAIGGGLALAVGARLARPRQGRVRVAARNRARHPAHLGHAAAPGQSRRAGAREAAHHPVRARRRRRCPGDRPRGLARAAGQGAREGARGRLAGAGPAAQFGAHEQGIDQRLRRHRRARREPHGARPGAARSRQRGGAGRARSLCAQEEDGRQSGTIAGRAPGADEIRVDAQARRPRPGRRRRTASAGASRCQGGTPASWNRFFSVRRGRRGHRAAGARRPSAAGPAAGLRLEQASSRCRGRASLRKRSSPPSAGSASRRSPLPRQRA